MILAIPGHNLPLHFRQRRSESPPKVLILLDPGLRISGDTVEDESDSAKYTRQATSGDFGRMTNTSVEHTPANGAIETLWKYGRNFPNSRSPVSKPDLLLVTSDPDPCRQSVNVRRSKCSRPMYRSSAATSSARRPWRMFRAMSPTLPASHSSGISPISLSGSRCGNSFASSPFNPGGASFAALARTGSKSTNHDLNSARAPASRLAARDRLWSMRASSADNTPARFSCSSLTGRGSLRAFSTGIRTLLTVEPVPSFHMI